MARILKFNYQPNAMRAASRGIRYGGPGEAGFGNMFGYEPKTPNDVGDWAWLPLPMPRPSLAKSSVPQGGSLPLRFGNKLKHGYNATK
jgi:hypothetical protein